MAAKDRGGKASCVHGNPRKPTETQGPRLGLWGSCGVFLVLTTAEGFEPPFKWLSRNQSSPTWLKEFGVFNLV